MEWTTKPPKTSTTPPSTFVAEKDHISPQQREMIFSAGRRLNLKLAFIGTLYPARTIAPLQKKSLAPQNTTNATAAKRIEPRLQGQRV
jgi:hypothetical protein